MASSTVPTLKLDGRNWKVFQPIEASSDNKTRESCAKPNKLSVELPNEERLEDKLTEARSEGKAEAMVGAAQQTPSQSVEFEEYPNSRAGGPLKSKHIKVLNGMVEVPDEVENVNKMAHEDLPSKPCSTLEQPTAHNWAAENEGRLSLPARHEDEASSCTKQHVPNAHRVLLEGENTRCTSSNKRNLQEHMNTSRVLGMCTHSPSRREEPTAGSTESAGLDNNTEMPRNAWHNVSTGQMNIGDVNVPTLRNMPIEEPSFKNQDITFGRLVSPNKGHMASGVEGDITGGDGKPRDSEDSMTGSGDINSE
ncbi:hypothetical protein F5141DRAFT_1065756 [Pisolithus sp. B1]|nr:hypothetical protein F5141DRAFT_1065756 [Pisolithus sp. B1]